MVFAEIRQRNPTRDLWVRAMSSAWANRTQIYDPSLWQMREPEVEEKMLRDADIRHAVGYRRHMIAGRGWSLQPAREAKRGPLAVQVATHLLSKIKHFTQGRLALARAFLSGARFAHIHGRTMTLDIGDGVARTWWVPTHLQDLDKRMFRIVPDHDDDTGEIRAHWERWHIGRRAFEPLSTADARHTIMHVYEDDQAALGHGVALREALGWWWYAKTHVFSESLQAVERFAQGIIHAKVAGARDATTGLPNTEVVNAWRDVLEDLRARHVLVSDAEDDVSTIASNGEGHQLLKDMRSELRNTIYTLVIGANLTTSADQGGSYALAEVQENSTEALVQFDRETLQETLDDDLLGCIWWRNWRNLLELGIARERPSFTIDQETRQDPQERATVAATLNGMGVPLARDDVYEQTGWRIPEEGEPVIEGRVEPVMPPGMPGLPAPTGLPFHR